MIVRIILGMSYNYGIATLIVAGRGYGSAYLIHLKGFWYDFVLFDPKNL